MVPKTPLTLIEDGAQVRGCDSVSVSEGYEVKYPHAILVQCDLLASVSSELYTDSNHRRTDGYVESNLISVIN